MSSVTGVEQLRGIITALVTPFDAHGALDLARLRSLVERQIEAGVDGLCVLGGTGEPLALTDHERQQVVETTLEIARGRVTVIVGVLLVQQDAILRALDHAAQHGADAGMLIAPYFTRVGSRHVRQHFEEIGARSGLPLVIFNSPTRAGIDLDPDFLSELARDVPAIQGVKESSGDAARTSVLCERGVRVLQGKDGIQGESWERGAAGGIMALANLVPSAAVEMFRAFTEGNPERLHTLQDNMRQLEALLFRDAHPAPLKRAMHVFDTGVGPTRPPIYPLARADELAFDDSVRRVLAQMDSEPDTVAR